MKSEQKTIVIFSGYHLPHLGGIERYTDNLSKKLTEFGYKVIIVSSNFRFEDKIVIDGEIKNYLLPVRKLFVGRYPIPKRNKKYKQIISELDKENIHAIIVNTRFHLTTLVGATYAKKRHIPVFLIEHGSQHLTVDNKVLDFFGAQYEHALTKIVKRRVNYFYGVSKEACKWQSHFGITSDGVWYNSIPDFSKNYKIQKNKDKVTFLYAGRILKQKGVLELVENFVELSKVYDNIELNIAGDGNLLPELKEKYKQDNIHFLNKLDFDSLCKEYSKTDVFVYAPNWPEGLPTGILEAGLMECAVIASPQGGIKEIIHDKEDGLMINSKTELYQAMEELIQNKELRTKLANNLKQNIINNFTWDKTAQIIENDINEKVSNSKHS